MAIQLTAPVARPITDYRHMTSLMAASEAVTHFYTLTESASYQATGGELRIPARKGVAPLVLTGDAPSWTTRGDWRVPEFSADNGRFEVEIDNPGDIVSVLTVTRVDEGFTEDWGLSYAADAYRIMSVPSRNGKLAINAQGSNGVAGASPDLGQWAALATVLDFAGHKIARAADKGDFVEAALSELTPQTGPALLRIGAGTPSQPLIGAISDLVIVQGDLREMPDLLAAWADYAASGYGG